MNVMNTLEILLNGKPLSTDATTLQALLEVRGYDFKSAFACAINNAFVPRPQWSQHMLQSGDRIDVVTPITGG